MRTRQTTFWVMVLVAMTLAVGCNFDPQRSAADKRMVQAISDQKAIIAADEQAERARLKSAESAIVALIEQRRQATGRELESLVGPDDRLLLNWSTAEALNTAFAQLKSELLQAIAGLDAQITAKYAARMQPVLVADAYLDYVQAERHAASYAVKGFMEEMTGGGGIPSLQDTTDRLKSLGLPTSIDELQGWFRDRAVKTFTGALAGSPLSAAVGGIVKQLTGGQ